MKTALTLIALLVLSCFCACGQTVSFHLSTLNGLASNHVYCAVPDRNGYLWLGTDKGVYRYNGYQLKKYDYKDGLTNTDVYWIFEDIGARLWLHAIAGQMGYIRNGSYKRTVNTSGNILYPEYGGEINGTYYFVSKYNSSTRRQLCIAASDSILPYPFADSGALTVIHNDGIYLMQHDSIIRYSCHLLPGKRLVYKTSLVDYRRGISQRFGSKASLSFGRNWIFYAPLDNKFYAYNVAGRHMDSIDIAQRIWMISLAGNFIHVITENGYYQFDTLLNNTGHTQFANVVSEKMVSAAIKSPI